MGTSSSAGICAKSLGTASVEGFWDFCAERHKIWYRRFIEQQPPPWTKDEILQKFFFCNIFRRLDKGTQWYMDHVASLNMGFPDILWKTISYRLINSPEAFTRTYGGPFVPGRLGWRDMIGWMKKFDLKLHSKAYLTLPRPHHLHTRVERFEYVLGELEMGFDGLVEAIHAATTLEEVSHHLKQQYGIGAFLSLQIYRDLILAGQIPFTDDDWVEVGPGAKQGLLMLFGPRLARGEKRQRELIYGLAQSQEKPLAERGFWDFETMKISAGDMEQCACEYWKYARLSAGEGRRRYYKT